VNRDQRRKPAYGEIALGTYVPRTRLDPDLLADSTTPLLPFVREKPLTIRESQRTATCSIPTASTT
jgi:hypothetical protein